MKRKSDKLGSLKIFLLIFIKSPSIRKALKQNPICSFRSRKILIRVERTGGKSGQIGCDSGPGDSHEYPGSVGGDRRSRLLSERRQKSTGMRFDR